MNEDISNLQETTWKQNKISYKINKQNIQSLIEQKQHKN